MPTNELTYRASELKSDLLIFVKAYSDLFIGHAAP